MIDPETQMLRRAVQVPGCEPLRVVCTRSGLIAGRAGSGIFVLDPDSLDIRQFIDLPPVMDLAGSPESDLIAVLRKNKAIELVDGNTGQVLDCFDREARDPSAGRVWGIEMTRDGRSLFLGQRAIHRFDLSDGKLRLVASGPELSLDHDSFLQLSPDSQFLAIGFGTIRGTSIYDVDDLSRPVNSLRVIAKQAAIGCGGELAAGADAAQSICVVARRGQWGEVHFTDRRPVRGEHIDVHVAPHPTHPNKLAITTSTGRLYLVDVPEAE
jgi:hypothetical protein